MGGETRLMWALGVTCLEDPWDIKYALPDKTQTRLVEWPGRVFEKLISLELEMLWRWRRHPGLDAVARSQLPTETGIDHSSSGYSAVGWLISPERVASSIHCLLVCPESIMWRRRMTERNHNRVCFPLLFLSSLVIFVKTHDCPPKRFSCLPLHLSYHFALY